MNRTKLGIGSLLALLGAALMVLGPYLGFTTLGRPWSFIAGFLIGLIAGLGATLAVTGIIARRSDR